MIRWDSLCGRILLTSLRALASTLFASLALFTASPTRGSDGVIEISAARAQAGGISPADAAGFPVTLSQPGSYRLAGDLVLPDASTNAIEIAANRVWVDLNGFAIIGPASCAAGACPPGAASGVLQTAGEGAALHDGVIVGMSGDAVSLLSGARVRGVTISACGGSGIRVGAESLVTDSVVRSVGGTGILAQSGTALERNVIARAGLGGSGVSMSGGAAIGGNSCDDGRCSPRGERRFYLTTAAVIGSEALTACTAGYHVASLWEITDTSNLIYDSTLGQTTADSGFGPPTIAPPPAAGLGWVRTGYDATTQALAGRGNCDAWTSSSGDGTVAKLSSAWTPGSTVAPPWEAFPRLCSAPTAVWCVQD